MFKRLSCTGVVLAALVTPAAAQAGVQLGAFPNETVGITTLESHLGHRLAIDHSYTPWDFTSWAKRVGPDLSAGRTPLLSWSAAPLTTASAIASGSQDTRIRAAATALKAAGKTIYLRPFYEFDQPVGHPRYIGTPTQVVAAWKHTVDVFRSVGATNVKFVWCPMAFDYANGVAAKFWPGSSYVDYVAADGYNFPGVKWRAFGDIFAAAYTYAVAAGKPFFIAETASPGGDSRTPSWIQGAGTWAAAHADVTAIVYFDSMSPKGYDFRLYAHSSTFSAFRTTSLMTVFS
jgi:hypothetical protein